MEFKGRDYNLIILKFPAKPEIEPFD